MSSSKNLSWSTAAVQKPAKKRALVPCLRPYQDGDGASAAWRRSTKRQSLPLKRGMLHLAYDRKYPVQIVMSANKESVMSEKAMRVGFGQTVVVGYSDPIHSSQFPTFDNFASKVQKEWDYEWQRLYSSQPEDARSKPLQKLMTCITHGSPCVSSHGVGRQLQPGFVLDNSVLVC
ncbi:hypothetical protein ABBQ38_013045 [Trebouxia sp. C0009 RCD-2024]